MNASNLTEATHRRLRAGRVVLVIGGPSTVLIPELEDDQRVLLWKGVPKSFGDLGDIAALVSFLDSCEAEDRTRVIEECTSADIQCLKIPQAQAAIQGLMKSVQTQPNGGDDPDEDDETSNPGLGEEVDSDDTPDPPEDDDAEALTARIDEGLTALAEVYDRLSTDLALASAQLRRTSGLEQENTRLAAKVRELEERFGKVARLVNGPKE